MRTLIGSAIWGALLAIVFNLHTNSVAVFELRPSWVTTSAPVLQVLAIQDFILVMPFVVQLLAIALAFSQICAELRVRQTTQARN